VVVRHPRRVLNGWQIVGLTIVLSGLLAFLLVNQDAARGGW